MDINLNFTAQQNALLPISATAFKCHVLKHFNLSRLTSGKQAFFNTLLFVYFVEIL